MCFVYFLLDIIKKCSLRVFRHWWKRWHFIAFINLEILLPLIGCNISRLHSKQNKGAKNIAFFGYIRSLISYSRFLLFRSINLSMSNTIKMNISRFSLIFEIFIVYILRISLLHAKKKYGWGNHNFRTTYYAWNIWLSPTHIINSIMIFLC